MNIPGKIVGPFLLAAMLILPAACGDEERDEPARRDGPVRGDGYAAAGGPDAGETRVIVTNDDRSLPETCRPQPVAEAVIRFVDAFNRGDQAELSRVFFVSEGPSPPDFSQAGYVPWSWYSSSEIGAGGRIARNFTTSDQGSLLRYFAKRHGRGERLRLLKVSLTQRGLLDEEDNVGFLFVLTREADDLGPGLGGSAGIAYGKGAINCRNGRIFTWSMDMRARDPRTEREAAAWLCEDPPGWRPGKTVIACA